MANHWPQDLLIWHCTILSIGAVNYNDIVTNSINYTYSMTVTSSLDVVSSSMCTLCRRCHHHTIYCIQYANRSYILHIGPSFCVLRCDIALAGSGYITSSDTNSGPIFCIQDLVVYFIYYIHIYTCIYICVCVTLASMNFSCS